MTGWACRAPALLIGVGLGGLIDGIVLHQVLQWHHMISSKHPPSTVRGLEANTLADGVLHVATLILLLLGVVGVIRKCQRARPAPAAASLLGLVIAGWGIFNVVEGLLNHMLLGAHHVRDDLGGPASWDVGFLLFGLLLILGGWALHRAGRPVHGTEADSSAPGQG